MIVKNFLLADKIATGKNQRKNFTGVFQDVWAPTYPANHQSVTAFVQLSGERDEKDDIKFQIAVVDDDYKDVSSIPAMIFPGKDLTIDQLTQTINVEIIVTIENLVIPRPGVYEFRAIVNDKAIGTTVFRAHQLPGSQAQV